MASREYDSMDVGAPQMVGNAAGSLITVLKAVLVDGYEDKPPLGWELMFNDTVTHTAVFRPREGSRMFLRISDTGTYNNGAGCFARALSYENMFSADAGIHSCPIYSDYTDNRAGYIHKTRYNDANARRWKIVGDSCGFYLLTYVMSTDSLIWKKNRCSVCYFGDYIPLSSDTIKNKYNWCMVTHAPDGYGNNCIGAANSIIRNPYTLLKGAMTTQINSPIDLIRRVQVGSDDPFYNGNKFNELVMYNNLPLYGQFMIGTNAMYFGALPGFFEPCAPKTFNTHAIYYDELDENDKLVVTPTAPGYDYDIATYDNHWGRLAFLVGERFRYVF